MWGANENCQLGIEDSEDRWSPTLVYTEFGKETVASIVCMRSNSALIFGIHSENKMVTYS